MKKIILSLFESYTKFKSFDKIITILFEHYFLDKKLIKYLNSKQFTLKDKIIKLKYIENKSLTDLDKFLKDSKIKKSQNLKNEFLNLIQEFYNIHIKFYPLSHEFNFINQTNDAVSISSQHLKEEIAANPIYFNYSQAFFEMKEAKFTIAREIRNYV